MGTLKRRLKKLPKSLLMIPRLKPSRRLSPNQSRRLKNLLRKPLIKLRSLAKKPPRLPRALPRKLVRPKQRLEKPRKRPRKPRRRKRRKRRRRKRRRKRRNE